jgi:hypothetical protein
MWCSGTLYHNQQFGVTAAPGRCHVKVGSRCLRSGVFVATVTALLATVLLLGNLVPGRQVPEEKRSEVRPPRIACSSIYERLVYAE